MRNFVILLFILGLGLSIADNVLADTLYGLYGDNSASSINQLNRNSYQNSKQSKKKNKKSKKSSKTNNLSKQTTQYNYNYMPNYSQPQPDALKTLSGNANELMKKGSPNYGQYGTAVKKTNPIRIDNSYNRFNDSYRLKNQQAAASAAVNFDGDAVKFKQGPNGTIYGYNKYGKKIGVYRVNNNGTTTQFDSFGNKMGTFK